MSTTKPYISNIGGTTQKIEPEQGRTTIGGIKFSLLDIDNDITALIGADATQYQRKKVTIRAGYDGLNYSDYVTIMIGWVTKLKMDKSLSVWEFDVTDAVKWTQRKIFRAATESSPVVVQGNLINLLMAILTSTGNGFNPRPRTGGDARCFPAFRQ